jgi:hypothetical protein
VTLAVPARLNRQRAFRSATRFEWAGSTAPGGTLPATLAEALAFAQDSCRTDTTWQPTRWNDLYGD